MNDLFDDIFSGLGLGDDGDDGEDAELTGELFGFVAAVLDWLNDNDAFLFGK